MNSTQFAQEHSRCPRTAVSRALGLAEFELIYWGPPREATKMPQQMPFKHTRSTTPSCTEPI